MAKGCGEESWIFYDRRAALAGSKGYKGEGHRPFDGITGAGVEICYGMFMIEIADEIAIPAAVETADFWFSDVFGWDTMGHGYLKNFNKKEA